MQNDTAPLESYPDLFDDLAGKLAALLVDRGVEAVRAADVARHCAESVRRDWGGQKIYVPKGDSYDRVLRDQEIARRWNGKNTGELCAEFGVSETTIRRVATNRGATRRP